LIKIVNYYTIKIMRKIQGFTLIELMIIIVILGVLAALISGNFITSLEKGRDARRKADLEQVKESLEMFYEDNDRYPTEAELVFQSTFCHPTGGCTTKAYMQKVPNDPNSSRDYVYIQFGSGTGYGLYACLENDKQILPYESTQYGSNFSYCGNCRNPTDTGDVLCVWGISDPASNP